MKGGVCIVVCTCECELTPSYHFGSLSDLSAPGHTAILPSPPLVILQTCLGRLLTPPLRRDVRKRSSLALGSHSG